MSSVTIVILILIGTNEAKDKTLSNVNNCKIQLHVRLTKFHPILQSELDTGNPRYQKPDLHLGLYSSLTSANNIYIYFF